MWPVKNASVRTFDAFKGYVCITPFMTMDRSAKTIYASMILCTTYNLHTGGTGDQAYASHHTKDRAAVLVGKILQPWAYRHLRTGPTEEWYRTDPRIASSPRTNLKSPLPPQLPQPPQPLPAKQPVSCFRHSCNRTSAGFRTDMASGSPYCAPKDSPKIQ